MVAGVLTWAEGARSYVIALAGVLVGGVMDDLCLSATLRLWAMDNGLQLREFLCMSSVLLQGWSGTCIGD